MIVILRFLICFCLAGCASHKHQFDVPSEFMPIITEFEFQASQHGKFIKVTDLKIVLVPEPKDKSVAYCFTEYNKTPVIEVRQSWYEIAKTDLYHVETFMFHELGHCVLNKTHSYDPRHIMYPNPPSYNSNTRAEVLETLFE